MKKIKTDLEIDLQHRQVENGRTDQRRFSIDVNCVNLQKLITSEPANTLRNYKQKKIKELFRIDKLRMREHIKDSSA